MVVVEVMSIAFSVSDSKGDIAPLQFAQVKLAHGVYDCFAYMPNVCWLYTAR